MQPQWMGAADVLELQSLTMDRTESPKDRVSQECRVSAHESEPSNGTISKAPTSADVTINTSLLGKEETVPEAFRPTKAEFLALTIRAPKPVVENENRADAPTSGDSTAVPTETNATTEFVGGFRFLWVWV